MHPVGFTIEIYYDARPYELHIYAYISELFVLSVFDDNKTNNNNNNNNNNNKSIEKSQGGKVTILRNQQVQTDRTIPINKPGIIIRDNEKGTCMLIDVAISEDRNVIK